MGAFLRERTGLVLASATSLLWACSSGAILVGDDRTFRDSGGAVDVGGEGNGGGGAAGASADASSEDALFGANDVADVLVPPTAGDLIKITASCAKQISNGLLASRPGATANVAICQLSNAIFWTSGLAVDCAGKSTAICNATTDPQFQGTTTGVDSHGDYLDAAALPYVEVSAPTATFDYRNFGVKMGTVVAVVSRDKMRLEYGVVGTVGQNDIIGDASYAMANALGINPDPVSGGTASGVTYIAFQEPSVAVTVMEDHDEAVKLGQVAAAALVLAGK
jgi:hypothetical protein